MRNIRPLQKKSLTYTETQGAYTGCKKGAMQWVDEWIYLKRLPGFPRFDCKDFYEVESVPCTRGREGGECLIHQ